MSTVNVFLLLLFHFKFHSKKLFWRRLENESPKIHARGHAFMHQDGESLHQRMVFPSTSLHNQGRWIAYTKMPLDVHKCVNVKRSRASVVGFLSLINGHQCCHPLFCKFGIQSMAPELVALWCINELALFLLKDCIKHCVALLHFLLLAPIGY